MGSNPIGGSILAPASGHILRPPSHARCALGGRGQALGRFVAFIASMDPALAHLQESFEIRFASSPSTLQFSAISLGDAGRRLHTPDPQETSQAACLPGHSCFLSALDAVQSLGRGFRTHSTRPCGLMDKALVFGTKDCRFESCQGHLPAHVRPPLLQKLHQASTSPPAGLEPAIFGLEVRRLVH